MEGEWVEVVREPLFLEEHEVLVLDEQNAPISVHHNEISWYFQLNLDGNMQRSHILLLEVKRYGSNTKHPEERPPKGRKDSTQGTPVPTGP